jgi:hypothetical protein
LRQQLFSLTAGKFSIEQLTAAVFLSEAAAVCVCNQHLTTRSFLALPDSCFARLAPAGYDIAGFQHFIFPD